MSLQITWTLPGGAKQKAYRPYSGAEYCEANGPCPACHGKLVYHVHDTKEALIVEKRSKAAAEAELENQNASSRPEGGKVQLRGISISQSHDTIEGTAQCLRCFSKIGTLAVRVNTLFGLEEDFAVLYQSRPRVY